MRHRDLRQPAHRGPRGHHRRRSKRHDGQAKASLTSCTARQTERQYIVSGDPEAEAMRSAIGLARPGDVVVLAGKGHEDYQIIGSDQGSISRPGGGPGRDTKRECGERGCGNKGSVVTGYRMRASGIGSTMNESEQKLLLN